MKNEFEIVTHDQINNFQLFLVNLLYRTPHTHKDFEICLILNGNLSVITQEYVCTAQEGSLIVFHPFQLHEFKAQEPVTVLSLQISPSFFSMYYPKINQLYFDMDTHSMEISRSHKELVENILKLAETYYQKEENYELLCASMINTIFYQILQVFPFHIETKDDSQKIRNTRVRYLVDYIDLHYTEKLLLSEIAENLNVNLFYLSHFFKDNFGIPFQQYLAKIRCEKARQQLLLTDQSLLDISIACGFSDSKYFNNSFRQQYGCTPKEYRKQFEHAPLLSQQKSMLTTQEFLSDNASLILLNQMTDLKNPTTGSP
jgi:AraC-like DNA-binding protein